MAATPLPPIEFLRECFRYEPDTGAFFWKHRPLSHFRREPDHRMWNTRWAGLTAFNQVTPDGHLRAELIYDERRYRLYAARVAFFMMTGEQPETVDHRNVDPADNRFSNLRAATSQQNVWNLYDYPKPSGLLRGVFLSGKRFLAMVSVGQKKVRLGTFDTELEAHKAYCDFIRPQRGEFFNPGPNSPFAPPERS